MWHTSCRTALKSLFAVLDRPPTKSPATRYESAIKILQFRVGSRPKIIGRLARPRVMAKHCPAAIRSLSQTEAHIRRLYEYTAQRREDGQNRARAMRDDVVRPILPTLRSYCDLCGSVLRGRNRPPRLRVRIS